MSSPLGEAPPPRRSRKDRRVQAGVDGGVVKRPLQGTAPAAVETPAAMPASEMGARVEAREPEPAVVDNTPARPTLEPAYPPTAGEPESDRFEEPRDQEPVEVDPRHLPKPVDSLKRQRTKRKIVAGAAIGLVALAAVNTGCSVLNPPASSESVAAVVLAQTSDDPYQLAGERAGREFLEVFLTSATTEEQGDLRQARLQQLTAGQGGSWVEGIVPASKATRVVSGPHLTGTPNIITLPDGAYASYEYSVTLQTGSGVPRRFTATVLVSPDAEGRPFVALQPSLVLESSAQPENFGFTVPDRNGAVEEEVSERMSEFFAQWAKFTPDTPIEEKRSVLDAYIAPGSSSEFTINGVAGVLTFVDVSELQLSSPEGSNFAEGVAVTTWRAAGTEETVSLAYQVNLRFAEGRWFIEDLKPL